MFIGHFALALGAKRAVPRAPLGALVAAAQWCDLLWPALLLGGAEHVEIAPGDTAFTPLRFTSYPISHSLLAVALWGAAAAGLYWFLGRDHQKGRAALVVGLLVVSHWVLDAVTHRPDLPLLPGVDARVGLGLWRSVPATLLVEGAMFAAGAWLYFRATRARAEHETAGRWGIGALLAFLAVVYVMNVVGPPPPSTGALAGVTLAMWLLVAWAWWADRRREPADVLDRVPRA
jgi:hypothetical protein